MTLELKRYKDDFFNWSTEPYKLGGVKQIGLVVNHPEYIFIEIFDQKIFNPEIFEYIKDADTGTMYVSGGKWVLTMDDLISRSALLAEYDRVHVGPPGGARKLIEAAPAVDAVEVIRCEKCKHFSPRNEIEGVSWTGWCNYGEFHTDEDDFCSRGERRENETD